LAVHNSEYILGSACVGSENHCETNGVRDIVLTQMLFSDIRAVSGSEFFVFSRTVPHHIAPKTL